MVMHIPILKDLCRYVVLDIILFIIFHYRDFSDGPVVKILHSQSRGTGLIPVGELRSHMPQGAKINK